MPALQDRRHEAFAQARAKGALLIDAYESAGFVRHRGHPSRLALKDRVAERIAELRASQTDVEDTSPLGLLASLRRIIKAGEGSENPTLVNAARLAIVDASRLRAELARQQADEQRQLDKDFKDFASQAVAIVAPEPATERPSPPRQAPASARQRPADSPESPRALPRTSSPAPRHLPWRSPASRSGRLGGRLRRRHHFVGLPAGKLGQVISAAST